MKYTLELTQLQVSLVQSHILDFCNVRFRDKLEAYKFASMDNHDVFRVIIYHSLKSHGKVWKIEGVDEKTLKFISSEMKYWINNDFGREKSEIMSAKQLSKKIKNLLDIQLQRDKKLNQLI